MNDALQTLRAEAQRITRGKSPSGIRYPAQFRTAAATLARREIQRGQRVERVAQALGVAAPTLARWLRGRPVPRLRPVAVIAPLPPEPSGSGVVLITPQGVRVEGLDREGVVALLRALG